MNYVYNNQLYALLILSLLNADMFQALTTHHPKVRWMYVANNNSKMTVSEPGWNGISLYLLMMGC
jgi:hypothetical protein